MPHEAVTTTLYTVAATAKGGRDGTVSSEDGVIDLPHVTLSVVPA